MICEMLAGGSIGLKGASSVPVGGCNFTLITCGSSTVDAVISVRPPLLSSYLWHSHLYLELCHWKSISTDGRDDHHCHMGSWGILREQKTLSHYN